MRGDHLQLDRLLVFVAVAEAGGFTAAAKRLGTSKKLVSDQIHKLEVELGGALFVRTTRRVVPTAAGAELARSCQPALATLGVAVERFGAGSLEVGGQLRITSTPELAVDLIGRVLAEFGRLHPRLRIELISSTDRADLIAERVDLAFQVGWLRDSSLRSSKFGVFQQYVVGAPGYLEHRGAPAHPSELARHRWVELSLLPTPLRWAFTGTKGNVHVVRVVSAVLGNSPASVHGLVRGGAGISVLPDFIVQRDLDAGRLIRLLPSWQLPEGGYHFVYPGTGDPPLKVRAFIDFFRAHPLASIPPTRWSSGTRAQA